MDVAFEDDDLESLYSDRCAMSGMSPAVVRAFRKRMQSISSAVDERDFYNNKGLHYEKLKGSRQHQRSMRLNDQYRLVLELSEVGAKKQVVVIGIEDYH